MIKRVHPTETRTHILRSALRYFAVRGYAATSVQQIVQTAGVSKPALYYYFGDKAGLFRALVDQAHDERYHLMQEAAGRRVRIAEKLEDVVASVFEFSVKNQELMRLAFATAFSTSEAVPGRGRCLEKGKRNYEFVRNLIAQGQRCGELDRKADPDTLTMGIYGQLNSYVMVHLLLPDCPLNRETARSIVQLFMQGASSRGNRSGANGSSHKKPRARCSGLN